MDSYFKKQVEYTFANKRLVFNVAETLFSSFAIDHGTDILIRNITTSNPKTILDLGCGYGPIGIALASKFPHSQVVMLDKDLLAIRYSQLNIQENNIGNAEAIGSVGMEAVQGKTFDLIVSNIPAKIGHQAIIQEFILTSYKYLNPNGELWIVVVNALNHLIPRIEMLPNQRMQKAKKRKDHTVYKVRKTD